MKPTEEKRRTEFGYVPHYEVIHWSPKARIAAGAAGVAALVVGQRYKGITRQLASFAGISLGLRALLNRDLTQVVGTLLSPTIRLTREIIIDAPVDEVVEFWSNLENYPRFMSFIRKVEISQHGNLLWQALGPAGIPIRWEAHVLSWKPSTTISWQTLPGSPIFNSGKVSVQPLELERSKVRVEFAYALRAGSLGYAMARVLGFDPSAHIDADLAKTKPLIESQWNGRCETQFYSSF